VRIFPPEVNYSTQLIWIRVWAWDEVINFTIFPLVCPDIIIAWDSVTHSNSHCFRHHSPQATEHDQRLTIIQLCLRVLLSMAQRPVPSHSQLSRKWKCGTATRHLLTPFKSYVEWKLGKWGVSQQGTTSRNWKVKLDKLNQSKSFLLLSTLAHVWKAVSDP
jgi:hypothetical protein